MKTAIFGLLLGLAAVAAEAQPPPKYFVTSARTTEWAAWRAAYDANPSSPATTGGLIYKLVKGNADSGGRYSDFGQWATLMYQWTGDAAYVTKAWTQLTATPDLHFGGGFLNSGANTSCTYLGGNYSRYFGWQFAWVYTWLYPGLDGAQRTTFLNRLNAMAACTRIASQFTANDSDQTVGDYYFLAMLFYATGSYNASITTIWNTAGNHIGGYTATGSDGTTMRNAMKVYAETFSAGGEFFESSEYNLNSVTTFCMGAKALQEQQAPTDNYTEITTSCNDLALGFMHDITPGINHTTSLPYQWGDNQRPRDLEPWYRMEEGMALAGLTEGTSIGPKILDFILDWISTTSVATIDPYPSGFLVFNPSATRGDHSTLDTTFYASGPGIFISRTGWTAADSMLGFHANPPIKFSTSGYDIDHVGAQGGEFQFWKAGVAAIAHPIAYYGPGFDMRGTNQVTVRGLAAHFYGPVEYRSTRAHTTDLTNGFSYIVNTMGGSVVPNNYYNMPAQFLMEQSRALTWLRELDVIVTHDRVNAKTSPDDVGYYASLLAWMQSRPLKRLAIQMPVSPTLGSGYTDWSYSGANRTRVTHLLPTDATTAIEADTVWNDWFGSGGLVQSELKYHVNVDPGAVRQWDTFLNVWDVYNGTPATVTLVRDTTNKADGALISKSNVVYLVVYNAIQGVDIPTRTLVGGAGVWSSGVDTILDRVHLRTSGYTLSFTAPTSTTKAVLFDLDPDKSWTYKVDGGAPSSLTVTSDGIGVVNISGSGAKTLETISDVAPVAVVTATLPDGRKSTAYSQALTASGGNGSAYTWSKTAGDLPTNTSLSAGGTISGTPSAAGLFSFTVQACDTAPTCGTRDLSILVVDLPAITTVSADLSTGTVGAVYSETIVGTGGQEPYTWSIFDGALCDGLSLNPASGVISGTPTTLETCNFTVRLTDDNSATGDQGLQIIVYSSLPVMTLALNYGSTSVSVYYGIAGLLSSDACTAYLHDDVGNVIDTVQASTGAARRYAVFFDLHPLQRYGVSATCETASVGRTDFTTLLKSSGAGLVEISLKPPTFLNGAARVTVDYGTTTGVADGSVQNTSCGSGCTVNLSLSAGLYYWRHRWQTSGDAVLATSPVQPLPVP